MPELAPAAPATFDLDSKHVTLDGAYTRIAVGMEQFDQTQDMRERVTILEGMINGINGAYENDAAAGGSSFRDVSGNLLSGSITGLKCIESISPGTNDPDDLDDLEYFQRETPQTISLLGDYMKILSEDPRIFAAEISERDGAYPDLRRLADQEVAAGHASAPIPYYVAAMREVQQAEFMLQPQGEANQN